jgi:hypothetical protein
MTFLIGCDVPYADISLDLSITLALAELASKPKAI